MSSWSALSIYADAATLTNGATISATENNTERTNNRDWDIDVRVEGIATERHHNSASEPDDTSDGVIWSDSGNTLLKWRNGGAWENVAIATNANAFTGNNTYSGSSTFTGAIISDLTTDSSSTTTGAIQTDGGLGVVKKSYFGDTVTITSTAPRLSIEETGASADEGNWWIIADSGSLEIRTRADSGAGETAFKVTRSGTTVDVVRIENGILNVIDNLGINTNTMPTALVGGIAILNGTAASAALTNGCSAWAANDGASLSEWVFMSEGLTKYHLGGSADEDVDVGGVVDRQTVNVGNIGAGEDDLMSYTMPADLLDVDGKGIRITTWGGGNATDNVTFKLHFGGTAVTLVTGATMTDWRFSIIILREGAAVQYGVGELFHGTALSVHVLSATETLSGSVVVKFTGENTSDATTNAIIQLGMTIEVLN